MLTIYIMQRQTIIWRISESSDSILISSQWYTTYLFDRSEHVQLWSSLMWWCDKLYSLSIDDSSLCCVFALESLLRLDTPESSSIFSLFNSNFCKQTNWHETNTHTLKWIFASDTNHIANDFHFLHILLAAHANTISIPYNRIALNHSVANQTAAIAAGRTIANARMTCVIRWWWILLTEFGKFVV